MATIIEFIASFECKTLTILKLKCPSHGYMYVLSALIWKNLHNVKTVNVVTQIFDRFVG